MSKAAVLVRAGHTLICALTAAVTCLLSSEPSLAAPTAFSNQDCLDCHTDPTTSRMVNGKSVPIAVFPTNDFKSSIHGKLNCVDCHRSFTDLVHESHPPAPRCDGCHEAKSDHDKAVKSYSESIHGVSKSMGASAAANCADCHGAHNIMAVKDPASPVYKLNLPRTCAKCHSNEGITTEYRMKYPEVAAQYMDSMHGKALLKMGLIVAPSCNDCHGVHDIKRSVDRTSTVNHANVATTCGKCHLGIEKQYESSVHGQLLAKGDKRGPVCTDCHTAHTIGSPELSSFKEISDERCGKCHQDRLEHYCDTYHGKAMALGKPNIAPEVAACYDCHGAHDVLPRNNPASRLSKANIVGTCKKCHADANESFAQYVPHANPMDHKNYPALSVVFFGMTSLLVGVFAFFGGHTALWIFRSGYLYVNDSKAFREAKIDTQRGGEWFTRFAPYERFLHFLVATSFLLLVVTGMPLKFYYTDWAKTMFSILGGTQVARVLHHFGAIITFLYFGLHLCKLVVSSWRKRDALRDETTGKWSFAKLKEVLFGPDSMIPTWQDVKDFVAHQKWFFGKGPKPEFDRWTYWEKFDYFSVFWGVAIIGVSGLIMWFPQTFSKFLPGWIINIALIVHSDEALLAAGFIFTVHFFNTHFRIEKFPMDTVIFSGRISKAEMLHERKRWYDRLLTSGKLDQYRVKDEWERWKGIARSFGYFFFGLGLVLLVLIVYAMVTRLAH